MLKTNRILYPKGIAIQAKPFARYIESRDTRLVTVGQERCRVYRYEGAIHGLDDAVVLLAWKVDQPMTPEHLHVVLSTDQELGDEDILRYDVQCWTIECFFRQAKDQLKLNGYRVRHIRAVKRYGAGVLSSCVYRSPNPSKTSPPDWSFFGRGKATASWNSFMTPQSKIFPLM